MMKFFDRKTSMINVPGSGVFSFWKSSLKEDWEDEIVFKGVQKDEVLFSLSGDNLPRKKDRVLFWNVVGPILVDGDYRGKGFIEDSSFPVLWVEGDFQQEEQEAKVFLETMFLTLAVRESGLDLSFWTNLNTTPVFPSEEEEGTVFSNDLQVKLDETSQEPIEVAKKVLCVARGEFAMVKLLYKGEESLVLVPVFQRPTFIYEDKTQADGNDIPMVDFI